MSHLEAVVVVVEVVVVLVAAGFPKCSALKVRGCGNGT